MLLTQNTDLVSQAFDGLLRFLSQAFDGLLRFLAKFGDISLQVGDIWLGCQIVLQQCAKRLHLDDRLLFTEANFLQLSGVVKGIENQHACSDFL